MRSLAHTIANLANPNLSPSNDFTNRLDHFINNNLLGLNRLWRIREDNERAQGGVGSLWKKFYKLTVKEKLEQVEKMEITTRNEELHKRLLDEWKALAIKLSPTDEKLASLVRDNKIHPLRHTTELGNEYVTIQKSKTTGMLESTIETPDMNSRLKDAELAEQESERLQEKLWEDYERMFTFGSSDTAEYVHEYAEAMFKQKAPNEVHANPRNRARAGGSEKRAVMTRYITYLASCGNWRCLLTMQSCRCACYYTKR